MKHTGLLSFSGAGEASAMDGRNDRVCLGSLGHQLHLDYMGLRLLKHQGLL